MTTGRCSVPGLVCLILAVVLLGPGTGVVRADVQPDSLGLQQPAGFKVWREFNQSLRSFTVYMTWDDVADSCGAFIHPVDTTGWAVDHFDYEMSVPSSGGVYLGDIDRTIAFRARESGFVGQDPSIVIEYAVRKEDNINGTINVGTNSYQPGEWIPLRFKDVNTGDDVDFGILMSFTAGWVDRQGGLLIGAEDFEGYHIWRGIEEDGSDLEIIGELSKEEAFFGQTTGGSFADSLYYYSVIPALRNVGTWFSQFGSIECLGTRIDLDLGPGELMWFDCNVFNGFTYYYAVTTFDRDYEVLSGRQGLTKFDNCQPVLGVPFVCRNDLVDLVVEVDAQSDIDRVYAVPNPFRSGGSRLTQESYHNFPDNMVRFVNVPDRAIIRIYNIAGDLVWEGHHNGFDGNIEWDVTNDRGNAVASGVYVYKVRADTGDAMYGRLIVIR